MTLSESTLLDLAARVERGSGPDRELDLAIITAVYPFALVLKHNCKTGKNETFTYHEPTSSLDSVTALLERVLPDAGWMATRQGKADGFFIHAAVAGDGIHGQSNQVTSAVSSPARALLAATLRALADAHKNQRTTP